MNGSASLKPSPTGLVDLTGIHSRNSAKRLNALLAKYSWLCRLKPRFIADWLGRLLDLNACRSLVTLPDGTRLFLDPFTNLGMQLFHDGAYEPDTLSVLRSVIKRGDIVVDVGANEGYFSVVAGLLVGETGHVISVEPQARLCDIIEINLRMNNITWASIVPNAVGGRTGERHALHLYSRSNTGMSTMVRKYHSSIRSEVVEFVAFDDLLRAGSISHVDFVKIDVEGFELEVVTDLLPLIAAGRVRSLYVDYHAPLLAERGIDPLDINSALLKSGMQIQRRGSDGLSGYVLYQSAHTSAKRPRDCHGEIRSGL